MADTKKQPLQQLSVAELRKQATELRQKQQLLRLQKKAAKLQNPSQYSRLGDELARVLTVLTVKEKEIAVVQPTAPAEEVESN